MKGNHSISQDNALKLEDLTANYGQATEPRCKICTGSTEEAVKPCGVWQPLRGEVRNFHFLIQTLHYFIEFIMWNLDEMIIIS